MCVFFSIGIILVLYFCFYSSTHVWTLCFIINGFISWICFCCWLYVVFSFYYYSCVFLQQLLVAIERLCTFLRPNLSFSISIWKEKKISFYFWIFFVCCFSLFAVRLLFFHTETIYYAHISHKKFLQLLSSVAASVVNF